MHVIALTGGIGSGKSQACRFLEQLIPSLVLFDCDLVVHQLLQSDARVIDQLVEAFGAGILHESGGIDRGQLRAKVYADASSRTRLEEIVHPRVREECLDSRVLAAKQGARWFVADVPLLFEKGFDFGQTQAIVIAVSRATQIRRIRTRNRLDELTIESILAAQLPLQEKLSRADLVFWNEGPSSVLHSQLSRFVTALS